LEEWEDDNPFTNPNYRLPFPRLIYFNIRESSPEVCIIPKSNNFNFEQGTSTL